MRRLGAKSAAVIVLALIALFAVPNLASAGIETEPNNSILTASGPIGSETVTGEIEAQDDVDWYWMQLGSQQQLTLSTSTAKAGDCEYGPNVAILSNWSEALAVLRAEAGRNQEARFSTPAGGGRYYVRVSSESGIGCQYSFSLTPASAFVAAPPALPVVQVPEPNEFPSQAYGPLRAGILYQGQIETSNDKDWLYLEGRAEHQVKVIQTKDGCSGNLDTGIFREGDDGAKGFVGSGEYEGSSKRRITIGPKPWKYYLAVEGDQGCTWQLEVSPPQSLVGSGGSDGRQSDCAAAKRSLRRKRSGLKGIELARSVAHTPRQRRVIAHKLAVWRHLVRVAHKQVQAKCK